MLFLFIATSLWSTKAGDIEQKKAPPRVEKAKTPWMGVLIRDSHVGVFVYQVYHNTPAYQAGISQGDIIMAINRHRVYGVRQTVNRIRQKKVGETVMVHFSHRGQVRKKILRLVPRPEDFKPKAW